MPNYAALGIFILLLLSTIGLLIVHTDRVPVSRTDTGVLVGSTVYFGVLFLLLVRGC